MYTHFTRILHIQAIELRFYYSKDISDSPPVYLFALLMCTRNNRILGMTSRAYYMEEGWSANINSVAPNYLTYVENIV